MMGLKTRLRTIVLIVLLIQVVVVVVPEAAGATSLPLRGTYLALGDSIAFGDGIERRLTGKHETARYDEFSYGVSNRGASIRIPWVAAKAGKGWLEDRRPNANMDPYVVCRLMIDTVCSDAEGAHTSETSSNLADAI